MPMAKIARLKPASQASTDRPKSGIKNWPLLFVAYFFFCLVNGTAIGLTPENEFLNGFAQVIFFWSPLMVCIALSQSTENKGKKMMFLLAIIPTIWFAVLPTIMSGAWNMLTTGHNSNVRLVSVKADGQWQICHYHFSPKDFGEPNDYQTREKSLGCGFKIVRKI